MSKQRINIYSLLTEEFDFYIRGVVGGERGEVTTWKYKLFQHHATSYYGTLCDEVEIDGHNWLKVPAEHWLELMVKRKFNSFCDWEWDELSAVCFELGPTLLRNASGGRSLLDMSEISDDQPSEMLSQFPEDFLNKEIDCGFDKMLVRAFASKWLSKAKAENPLQPRLTALVEKVQEKEISTQKLQQFFDQERFQIWQDATKDEKPFTIGVRITEPNFELGNGPDDWKLEVFMRSKKKPDTIFLWKDRKRATASWKKFYDEVAREIERWQLLFPWISDEIDEADAWHFLTEAAEIFEMLGIEVLLPAWWQTLKKSKVKVKANVGKTSESIVGLDALVNFDWQLAIGDEDLSAAEFQELVEKNRQMIYIGGKWVRLDGEFMRKIQSFMKKAEEDGVTLQDILKQQLSSENEEESEQEYIQIHFKVHNELQQLMNRLRETKEIPTVQTPQSFQGELRHYQKQGMSWLTFMREHGFGCILADDMGLGKTIQIISYLLAQQDRNPDAGPSLIVCPMSVIGNWQHELVKFAPNLRVALHYGTNRKHKQEFYNEVTQYDVVLTSYGLLQQDEDDFKQITWNAMILDEAQHIKNTYTKQSKAARSIMAYHHIAVTGTPIENRLSELWTIFDFAIKGYLGSATSFDKNYAKPIERNGDEKKKKQLQQLIQPFLLRRTKLDKDVELDLPDKLEQKEYVSLTREQASLYEVVVQETLEKLDQLEGFQRRGLVLQMLTKLKQLCNHPALFLKEASSVDILERSGKTEKLVELLEVVLERGESVLIFTQFIGMGEMLQQLLKEQFDTDVPFLSGSMTKAKRDKLVASFQNGEFPILLLSLKAGGTGLNLTAANHVVHYDRWWNPAVENQATDRVHRIGQSRFVHVHKLIATGTLEEKIDRMLEKKSSLNEVISGSDTWITELSTEEIKELVALS